MRRIDTAGETLTGPVDGINCVFTTQLPMVLDSNVQVWRNGLCKVAFLDDGYDLTDSRTVVMKEPPQLGDTIAVGYVVAGEQLAFGGVPEALQISQIVPQSLTATPLRLALRPSPGVAAVGTKCPPMDDLRPFRRVFRNGPTPLPACTPVFVGDGNVLVPSDASTEGAAVVAGFTEQAIAANTYGPVLLGGVIAGAVGGAQYAAPYFLAIGGGVALQPPTAPGSVVVRVGFAINQTDLMFVPQTLMERA